MINLFEKIKKMFSKENECCEEWNYSEIEDRLASRMLDDCNGFLNKVDLREDIEAWHYDNQGELTMRVVHKNKVYIIKALVTNVEKICKWV